MMHRISVPGRRDPGFDKFEGLRDVASSAFDFGVCEPPVCKINIFRGFLCRCNNFANEMQLTICLCFGIVLRTESGPLNVSEKRDF